MTANILRSQLPKLRFRTSLNSRKVQICVRQFAPSSIWVQMYTLMSWRWFSPGIISCIGHNCNINVFLSFFWHQRRNSTVRTMTSSMSTLCFFSIAFQSVSTCDKLGNANYACSKTDWSRRADRRFFLSSFIFLFLQLLQPETTDYLSTEFSLLLVLFLCDGFVHKSFEEIAALQIVT